MIKEHKNELQKLVSIVIKTLQSFNYKREMDPYWEFIFNEGGKEWYLMSISNYNGKYTFSQEHEEEYTLSTNFKGIIEIKEQLYEEHELEEINYWITLLKKVVIHLNKVLENPKKVYQEISSKVPYKYRYGTIQKALLWQFDNTVLRYDKKLNKEELKTFCKMAEVYAFEGSHDKTIKGMTANKYFEACKIAYLSGPRKLSEEEKNYTGRNLYKRFADGRHEGLLDIKGNSTKEFMDWLNKKHPKYYGGGHPWEIFRNRTTLNVSNYSYGQKANECFLYFAGVNSTFLGEGVKVVLALFKKGFPVKISDGIKCRNRLLGHDQVGILPEYEYYGNLEKFSEEITDTLYLNEINYKGKDMLKAITWNEIQFIFPKI